MINSGCPFALSFEYVSGLKVIVLGIKQEAYKCFVIISGQLPTTVYYSKITKNKAFLERICVMFFPEKILI